MKLKDLAVELMKLLNLHENVINDFINKNKLNRSETNLGILYWINEQEQQMVKEFELENQNTLVYHIIKTNTIDMGVVYDLLYVSEEDTIDDIKLNLDNDIVYSYSVTEFAEKGPIKVKKINGGLTRIY